MRVFWECVIVILLFAVVLSKLCGLQWHGDHIFVVDKYCFGLLY